MSFLSFILEIALCLIPIFCYFKIISRTKTKTSQIRPPEPPGAWPIIGHLHLLGGPIPLARTLGAMADKHGPIFSLRLGSHHGLVVSNWEAVKECLGTNDRVFASRPSMAVGKYIGYGNAVFALAPYGPYWRDVRKMVTVQLLTARRLDQLSHVRADEVGDFIKDLYSLSSKSCGGDGGRKVAAMSDWLEHLTFNITLRMLAGKRFSFGNGGDKVGELKEGIKKELYLSGVFVFSDAIPSLEWLDIGGYIKAMKQAAKDIDQVLEGWVKERIQTRKENSSMSESDFMDVLLSAIKENEMISGYDRGTVIKATLQILILTGSESTAETLIWALSLLLNNPHAMKKAQHELDAHIGPNRWVQESDLNHLNYLQAIVQETLRLYPPGPLAGPHVATQHCSVGDYHIPKGTRLIVNLWKLHRDPDVWSDPYEFRPERFMNESRHLNFRGQCYEYIPFSSGRRICPGMTFGLQVIQLTLARLIQGFDISTPTGEAVDMGEGLGIALPKNKPLEVVLTPRLAPELYHA